MNFFVVKSIGMAWEDAQQAAVDVWPNVSLTRAELRLRLKAPLHGSNSAVGGKAHLWSGLDK